MVPKKSHVQCAVEGIDPLAPKKHLKTLLSLRKKVIIRSDIYSLRT